MPPIRVALLAVSIAAGACVDRPTETESPGDVGIEGDPTEIEGREIGEETDDNARAVEPGPAELEVGEPQQLPGAQPN